MNFFCATLNLVEFYLNGILPQYIPIAKLFNVRFSAVEKVTSANVNLMNRKFVDVEPTLGGNILRQARANFYDGDPRHFCSE